MQGLLQFSRRAIGASFGLLGLWATTSVVAMEATQSTYHVAKEFPVPGSGSWDYLTVDSLNRRLYVSHGAQVEVLSADTGAAFGVISGTPGVHGIAIAAALQKGFTSNGGDSSVTIFSLETLATVAKIPVSAPDFIVHDPVSNRVFPLGTRTSVLDARSNQLVAAVDLPGDPEAAVPDGAGHLFINIRDKAEVAVLDTRSLRIVSEYPIEGCLSPHSLSFDSGHSRLLVGCANGFRAIDSRTGRHVGSAPMCGGVDGSAFDASLGLVFESCSEGIVSVIHEETADAFTLLGSVITRPFAKTMTFDPRTGRIYLSSAEMVWRTQSGVAHQELVPGTFRILVLER